MPWFDCRTSSLAANILTHIHMYVSVLCRRQHSFQINFSSILALSSTTPPVLVRYRLVFFGASTTATPMGGRRLRVISKIVRAHLVNLQLLLLLSLSALLFYVLSTLLQNIYVHTYFYCFCCEWQGDGRHSGAEVKCELPWTKHYKNIRIYISTICVCTVAHLNICLTSLTHNLHICRVKRQRTHLLYMYVCMYTLNMYNIYKWSPLFIAYKNCMYPEKCFVFFLASAIKCGYYFIWLLFAKEIPLFHCLVLCVNYEFVNYS